MMQRPHLGPARRSFARCLPLLLLLPACGLNLSDNFLSIRAFGSFAMPTYLSATESCNADFKEPESVTLTLLKIGARVLDPDTGTSTDLDIPFEDDTFTLSHRPQQIYKQNIKSDDFTVSLVGKTITAFYLTLNQSFTAKTSASDALAASFATPTASNSDICHGTSFKEFCQEDGDFADTAGRCTVLLTTPITVGKGKNYTFTLKILWGRSIERVDDADLQMLAPSLELSAE